MKNKWIVFLIVLCFFKCSQVENRCFDWSILYDYYIKKSSMEGFFEIQNGKVTYFDQLDRKVEKYWFNEKEGVEKYRMYNWHYDTPESYFSINFSNKNCKISSIKGNPFFIESNIIGRGEEVTKDSIIFFTWAATTPFTRSILKVYKSKKETNKKEEIYSTKVINNKTHIVDKDLEEGNYLYTFQYHLYQNDIEILIDSLNFYFEYNPKVSDTAASPAEAISED